MFKAEIKRWKKYNMEEMFMHEYKLNCFKKLKEILNETDKIVIVKGGIIEYKDVFVSIEGKFWFIEPNFQLCISKTRRKYGRNVVIGIRYGKSNFVRYKDEKNDWYDELVNKIERYAIDLDEYIDRGINPDFMSYIMKNKDSKSLNLKDVTGEIIW